MEYLTSPNIAATNYFLATVQPPRNVGTDEAKASKGGLMYVAAFSSLMLAMSVGVAMGYNAPATYDMTVQVNSTIKPTNSEVTWMGSMLALGGMLGGILAGPLADKFGRKETLIFNIIPFGIGWLVICFAKGVPQVIFGRFMCGLACGIVSATVPTYCVEISTDNVRGILGTAYQGFLVAGNLLSVVISLYVSWAYLAAIGATFVTVGMMCFIPMPESPRWLLSKGKLKKAISVTKKLRGSCVDAEKECYSIYKSAIMHPKGQLSFSECKHPAIYKPAIIAIGLMFFRQFSGVNVIVFYSVSIFSAAQQFMDPKKAAVVLIAVQLLATLLGNLIVDKAGRKILLISSGIFMALCQLSLGTYYYMSLMDDTFQNQYSWIPLASLLLFVNAFSIGFGCIPSLLTAEMVPVRARSTVCGLATCLNALFAFIVTKTFSELEDLIGNHGTFWFYSSLSLIGTVFVILMVPETKGKRLEEIEKLFSTSETKESERTVCISDIA